MTEERLKYLEERAPLSVMSPDIRELIAEVRRLQAALERVAQTRDEYGVACGNLQARVTALEEALRTALCQWPIERTPNLREQIIDVLEAADDGD